MDKKTIEELKEKLEQQKSAIEGELKKFAKKDTKVKGDWDTEYPKFTSAGQANPLEEEADAVEEYVNRLPVEHTMELRLKNINAALERIKKGAYGKCANCNKEIPEERLKINPEATFCKECQK